MRTRTAWHYLTLALAALLLGGCGTRNTVTLYLPEGDGLRPVTARVEDGPRGLLDALTEAGALPEADGEYLYCSCRTEEYTLDGESRPRVVVWLDIAGALGGALQAMEDERPAVQALVNTLLDYYDAEVLALTVEGVNLETRRAYYGHGIVFDEYASTRTE